MYYCIKLECFSWVATAIRISLNLHAFIELENLWECIIQNSQSDRRSVHSLWSRSMKTWTWRIQNLLPKTGHSRELLFWMVSRWNVRIDFLIFMTEFRHLTGYKRLFYGFSKIFKNTKKYIREIIFVCNDSFSFLIMSSFSFCDVIGTKKRKG